MISSQPTKSNRIKEAIGIQITHIGISDITLLYYLATYILKNRYITELKNRFSSLRNRKRIFPQTHGENLWSKK
jgi:hypothetical protein